MARNKVSVVGAGNVGANIALWLGIKEIADVHLLDIAEGMPAGKALDLMQAGPVEGFNSTITGSNDYKDLSGSDVVVITAGLARKPGMSRSDLIEINQGIIKDVMTEVVTHSPQAIVIVVTNPLDVMVHAAWKLSGLPPERVIGMAGALDSARLRTFVAMELNVSVRDVHAMVLGGHADTMVPLQNYTTVSGIPIAQLMSQERIDAIVKRTRTGGGEIVGLLKTGSAFYAPSASVADMVESILRDTKRIIPCAAYCDGKYGLDGVYVGVPVKLGREGVEEIIEVEFSEDEQKAFNESVAAIKKLAAEVKY